MKITISATAKEALDRVLSQFDTQQDCATALGTTQATVSRWARSQRIGGGFVLKAEEVTGVARHDLRPDIYPRETMTDRTIGSRFAGGDRHAGSRAQFAGAAR